MKYGEILILLEDLLQLLEKYKVGVWETYFDEIKNDLTAAISHQDDVRIRSALERVIRAYGGMGSFRDLYITYENGSPISPEEISVVNSMLDHLQSRLYALVEDVMFYC